MALIFATVLPGLEYVLESEVRRKIADARIEQTERGKVYFTSEWPVDALMALRTADNLYRQLHRFRVGPHKVHLAGIEQEIARLDLARLDGGRSGPVGFKVNASRAGKHTYSRFEAAEAAARGIAKRKGRFWHDMSGAHEMEFRLDIDHETAVFAARLTDASYRYRKELRAFTRAALRPPVAHALVWLSQPEAADVFVDPCCGSGTIVAERLAYPYRRIYGGDVSSEAVASARENAGFRDHAEIRRWDARRLPLDAGYADKIVVNLPFGRQISADEDIPALYLAILRELNRVLNKHGRAICLSDADAALETAAELAGLDCRKEATLHLKGLHPAVYRLKKQ